MRYAIYYTPHQQHPLSKRVETWLGRNAFTNEALMTSHGLDDCLASPRRYGFHGTLKAPFHLTDGANEDELIELFDRFAASHQTFEIESIKLERLGDFFALVPSQTSQALNVLAEDAIRTFEPIRAPLSEADIARRNPDTLTQRQRDNLIRWGYPFVFEDFRFHLTLTDKIDSSHHAIVEAAARHHFADFIDQPLLIATVGLFIETEKGMPLHIKRIASLS